MNVFSVEGRSSRMGFIVDVYVVRVGRYFLTLSASIVIYTNGFSLVFLGLYMRVCKSDLGNGRHVFVGIYVYNN